jgi:hypothetical protein
VVGLLLDQCLEVFKHLERLVVVFGFEEVYLCVAGLVVNEYYEVSRASNQLYREWTA